jgi:hypothetical protein
MGEELFEEDEPELLNNDPDDIEDDEPKDLTDIEADADTLAGAGYGTDEDYNAYCYPEE